MFTWLANAFNSVTGKIDATVQSWVHNIVNALYSFLHTIFGNVGKEWDEFGRSISTLKTGINDLGTWSHYMLHLIWKSWIPSFIKYIDEKILDPLLGAIKWIGNEGATVYYYISHPDDLVDLIFSAIIQKIETTALDTAEKLGTFFLAFIIKNIPQLLKVIEDIIDATL